MYAGEESRISVAEYISLLYAHLDRAPGQWLQVDQ